MNNTATTDLLFQQAVAAIDNGDTGALKKLLEENPSLACQRLESPGAWLREKVGNALESFFVSPYLLWFVAEDPIRNNKLPPNIASITSIIINVIKQQNNCHLQEQLDYAIKLVAWSPVARNFNVQIPLLDVLLDAGASPNNVNEALVNGNFEAAQHLLDRGALSTLAAAICLERWQEADNMNSSASDDEKQFSLVVAALHGRTAGVAKILKFGADPNKPSRDLHSHGTPLHHAVCSGSLEIVTMLVEAGARLDVTDTAYHATPLGWAQFFLETTKKDFFKSIIDYLENFTQSR